jgi:hypothetical protein
MKPFTALLVLAICLCTAGCSSVYTPKYVAEMMVTRPGETDTEIISEAGLLVTDESFRDDSALVEDDIVKINVFLSYHRIYFGFFNKTDQPLEIIWSEATVTHRGISEPFLLRYPNTETRNGGPGYHVVLEPIQVIDPLGQATAGAFPKSFRYTDHKYFFDIKPDREQSRAERKATVAKAVGQKVEVSLPMNIPEGRRVYTISLTVHSAEVRKYTDYIM